MSGTELWVIFVFSYPLKNGFFPYLSTVLLKTSTKSVHITFFVQTYLDKAIE